MDQHSRQSPGILPMKTHFKIRRSLLDHIRTDLERPHVFAGERVGWITTGVTRVGRGSLILLAIDYHPVADGDYLNDRSVGAMIGSNAIRTALERDIGRAPRSFTSTCTSMSVAPGSAASITGKMPSSSRIFSRWVLTYRMAQSCSVGTVTSGNIWLSR